MFNVFPGQYSPVPSSFQAIAVANGSASPVLTLPTGPNGVPKYALIQVKGADVNWRDDGVAPTAALGGGMVLAAEQNAIGFNGNLKTVQFISTTAAGSTVLISYYY